MSIPPSMTRSVRRLAWIALATAATFGSAVAAQAAPTRVDWSRIDALVSHRAYPIARAELTAVLPVLIGEDRYRARYWLGYVERRLGDAPEAEQVLTSVPPESLWYPAAQGELTRELESLDRWDEAESHMRGLLSVLTGRSADEERLELADSLFLRGRYAQALLLYEDAMTAETGDDLRERAAYATGWCYERSGNPARAIWSWKEAIRLFPESPQAVPTHLMLANLYLVIGKPLLASDEVHALTSRIHDPELAARAQFLAGEGYAAVGNWPLAEAAYAFVKPGSRWSEPAEYGAAYARWQSGDPKGARPALAAWIARYPSSPVRGAVLYAMGRVELELGNPEAARTAFEKAIADPRPSSYVELSLFGLAELDYNANRFETCADMARRLLASYPQSHEKGPTRWLLAESLLALKRYPEAIAVYQELARNEADLSFLEGKGDAVTFRLGLAHFRTGDYLAAASYLRSVAEGHYGEQALYWLAESTYRLGDYAEAGKLYERFAKRYAGSDLSALAWYGAGYCRYHSHDWPEALKLFKMAAPRLAEGPIKTDALLRLGALELNAHEWKAARETYESLYGSRLAAANAPDVLFGLAYSTFRAGDEAQAAKLSETFAERYPEEVRADRARLVAGQAYFALGKYSEAALALSAVLNDAKATSEEKSDARSRLGAAYFNAGLVDQAIEAYQGIYQDASQSLSARQAIAQPLAEAKLKKGDLDGAKAIALEQATGSVWTGDFLVSVAKGYLDKQRPADAVSVLSAVDSPSPETRHLLADAYRASGNPEAAIATLEAIAHDEGPHQADWLSELAERYLDANDPARAQSTYEALAKRFPAHPTLLKGEVAVAAAFVKNGQDALAVTAYRTVLARFSANHEVASVAALRIAQIQLKGGRFNEAALAYREAEKVSVPGSLAAVQARYWLGYTLVAAHRYEDAATELAKLKVPASVPREWQALAWLKQGEALEHLRRWKDAERLYRQVTKGAQMPAPEKSEASDRLKWIAENVKP